MDLRNFGGGDVDIDLERGMDEVIYEEHSEGRRAEGEEKMGLLDNKSSRRGRKKGSRKPPKPPRPPRAPLLDAADRKLVREISELATLKRARVERMKALKNKRNTEGASSGSNLCALVVTILFCFIIIWQGLFSKGSSSAMFHGSPHSSLGNKRGPISVQLNQKISHGPHSLNSASHGPHSLNSASP